MIPQNLIKILKENEFTDEEIEILKSIYDIYQKVHDDEYEKESNELINDYETKLKNILENSQKEIDNYLWELEKKYQRALNIIEKIKQNDILSQINNLD